MATDRALDAEVILFGTSPLVLIRALGLQREGRTVMLVDRSPTLGGSWYTPSVLGFSNVEVGVHLLENRPQVYTFLEHRLSTTWSDCGDCDFGLIWGKRLPMPMTRIVLHMLVGAKALLSRRFDQARRMSVSVGRSARYLNVGTKYPSGGCAEITNRLVELLDEGGATFRLDREITSLAVDPSAPIVTCTTSSGILRAEAAVLSSRAHAPIDVKGRELTVPTTTSTSWSLILHLRATKADPFGYVEVIGDPLIRRFRDVSRFAAPKPPSGEVLLCVQLRPDPASRTGTINSPADEVAERLAKLGLLIGNVEVLGHHMDAFELTTINDRDMRRLHKELSPAVLPLRTTDFAEGLVELLASL